MQTSGSSPKASKGTKTIASPESNAYLGQLLGVGQIVHSDGQEHVQQRVWGDELRMGK